MSSLLSSGQAEELRLNARRILTQIDATNDSIILENLYTQYNSIVDQFQELDRGVDRFSIMPTELVLEIMENYCAVEPNGPFILTLVCTRWFELVSRNGRLWTNVIINTHIGDNWQERLDAFYQLSRGRLLDITLYSPISEDELQIISQHNYFGQWRSLSIIDVRPSAEQDQWRFPLRLNHSRLVLQLLKSHSFPQLRDINIQTKVSNPRAPLIWSHLFSAKEAINGLGTETLLLSHLTVNIFLIDIESLLSTLKEVPSLLYLKLTAQRRLATEGTASINREPVSLLHLQDLILEDGAPTQILIDQLDVPQLRYLKISFAIHGLRQINNKIRTLQHLKYLNLVIHGANGSPPDETPGTIALERLKLEHHFSSDWTHPPVRNTAKFYLGYMGPLFRLFPSVKRVGFLLDRSEWSDSEAQAAWHETIKLFPLVEDLSIQEIRSSRTTTYLDYPFRTSFLRLVTPQLRSLHLKGQNLRLTLSMIEAPKLQKLHLVDIKALDPQMFLTSLLRSPQIQSIRLESMHIAKWNPATKPVHHLPSFDEIVMTHDAYDIFEGVGLSSVRTLRLIGVLQGVAMKRDMYHFDQREIHLRPLCELSTILKNLTRLDLCVAGALFPIVIGLESALPHLFSLENISLPRALHANNVLVDVLVQSMLTNASCPKLEEIYTEDYPEWTSLTNLIAQRSAFSSLTSEKGWPNISSPRSIRCLHLPALPHISILRSLQAVLAGKFRPLPGQASDGSNDRQVLVPCL
jgi:hypothetical protein